MTDPTRLVSRNELTEVLMQNDPSKIIRYYREGAYVIGKLGNNGIFVAIAEEQIML